MKRLKNIVSLLIVLLSINCLTAIGQIKITDVKPTPFFPKVENKEPLKQLAHIYVEAAKEMPVLVKISIDGNAAYIEKGQVKKGLDTLDAHVLDIQKPTNVKFEILDAKQKVLVEKEMTWQPQKKWKVYYAAVSHQDLGFITYYQNLRRANREGGIDIALDYCNKTDLWDEDSKFRWNVESSEPIIRWMSKRSPEKIQEFKRRIEEGRIGLGAIHNTISSQMAGYEVLARSFYTPNRYVIDKLGIEPAKVAVIDDVTGITRSWPLYSKEAEIPYLMHGSNYPNCLNDMYDLPVFYWKSPDGDAKNRTLCRTDSYYSPNKVKSWDREGVAYLIDRHVNLNWEYDCILAYDSHDFADPTLDNAKNIKEWNSKFEYPKFRCSIIQSFFDDVAQQLDPEKVVETSKDAPDSWDDQDATDAALLAKARKVNFEIPTSEKFATVAMALSGGYPEKEIFQAYNRTVMYHEHTNGAIDGGNHQYYETERVMHQKLIDEAIEFSDKVLDASLEKIGKQINTKTNALAIYNPLNWVRDELVYLNPDEIPFKYFQLIDPETKKVLDIQKLTNGKLVFFAEGIPALGYKTYTITKTKKDVFTRSTTSADDQIENDFYRVKIDKTQNIIADIIDKQHDVNIVDKSSEYALGEYVYYDHYSKEQKKTEFVNIEYLKGNLLDEIHISQNAYLAAKVELVVYIHHKTKKIDFALEVDKLSNGEELIGGWNRYLKEAAFCALPVLVPNYQHHHELAGAVTQPGNKDLQFEASESAFYAIQHFADASNDDFGVTLSTIESALIEYGYPRPVYWDNMGSKPNEEHVKPKNSNMFLYLMNNFFQTNIRVDQPGLKTFNFSINSHDGNWQKGKAYKFAWETSHPIIAQYLNKNESGLLGSKHSFLTVDKDNVICSTLKKAEANGSGYVLRFFELEGKPSKVKMKLDLNQIITHAYALSLIENDLEELTVNANNEVEFEINGHGIKTIRVQSKPTKTSSIQNLNAEAISNAEIKLNWMPVNADNISHYNVYRSHESVCEANALNFVGIADGSSYLDKTELNYGGWASKRLDQNTTYYYRVVSVDKFNNPGQVSEVIECKTLPTSVLDALPNKVLGVYTVHVSPLAPENYINVWFYTNFEKDVDKYEIHRGETADFVPNAENLIHTLVPSADSMHFSRTYSNSELNRQMYADKTAKVNKAYYYKVCAIDNNENKGEYSDAAYAIMESVPVKITTISDKVQRFEDFKPVTTVKIDCTEPGYDIYYTVEGEQGTNEAKKYTGEFDVDKSKRISVTLTKIGENVPVYRYRRLVVVSQALSQSDYGNSYSAVMAYDGLDQSQWVSKQYGGKTKGNPADVWVGINLGANTSFDGVKIIGDEREMMPVQNNYRIFIRNNGVLTELDKFDLVPDSKVKNTYTLHFNKTVNADGIMVFIDKDKLPKSELPEQDGLVRISELSLLTGEK
ncbi:glycosyl hydrolase-related protein [Draconibacterium sp.]|nr:glycosyl hydrolase-related protein [Draconibacterium sp.]